MEKGCHLGLVVSLPDPSQPEFCSDIHCTGPIVRQRRMSRSQQPARFSHLIPIQQIANKTLPLMTRIVANARGPGPNP